MPEIISDDIGSFPLPEGADRDKIRETASKIAAGEAPGPQKASFDLIVADMMQKKIDAGIMRPNYPQVTDMIGFYRRLMEGYAEDGEPWLVRKKNAVIPELFAIDSAGKRFFKETGEPLRVKVCVSGPLELYLKCAGGVVEEDLLMNVAKSISRFIENSLIDTTYMKTPYISIDEPSLGLNPNLAFDPDVLADAWEAAVKKSGTRDVMMHLHSVNAVDTLYPVRKINVIGVEYAASPGALDLLDRREIESCDKFLRVGVARTDIMRMVPEYNQKYATDIWKTKDYSGLTGKMENVKNIAKRLENAYDLFGDRIRYAGPDCGLGSWPGQDAAYAILKNAADAISAFNESKG